MIQASPKAFTKLDTERETQPADNDKICWIELKHYPYQPDHQVELLHLQAEADALLLQLQAITQRRVSAQHSLQA